MARYSVDSWRQAIQAPAQGLALALGQRQLAGSTGSANAPSARDWRKPASTRANFTACAPRSMPTIVCDMVFLFLTPVLQNARRLLRRAFWVTGLSSDRPVSRMAVIFFFTLPASPVATIR